MPRMLATLQINMAVQGEGGREKERERKKERLPKLFTIICYFQAAIQYQIY